ncbi:MAG: sensor domain-containing diguanylate cyclase, partial [Endomicrobiales bacterium]
MKRMEEALQEANEKLIVWVDELEQRGSEIFLLSEMADLLQTCLSSEEAHVVIGESLKKLFPNDSGAVCILKDSKNGLDIVTSWGDTSSARKAFDPNDCWAMRRGRLHVVEDVRAGLVCKHLNDPLPRAYMCIPMMAQSESLGILYLQNNPGDLEQPQEVRKLIVESKQRLAVTVAEHIALALANIRLRDTLRNQAIRDPLTGLFNRRYMEETLEREMSQARREKTTIGIIMLDIDFFKRFNDNFGHAAGDAMLRELGAFLKTSVRTGDIACRYGGEEFTLILPGANLEETANRARFIQQGIKSVNINVNAQVTRTITLSLGVACFPEHGNDLDEVLRSADTALYRAKAEGRDRVVPYYR